ncbi:MAG: folate-binding protein [Alcaligenaceae bacterium]|nr:folate-binding protein [Alcaligenaceae bacterium]
MSAPSLAPLTALDDLAVLTVTGADAADFLHRQLSNDVLHLGPAQARWAAYCTAQGRMLANVVVWRPAEDRILMMVSRDIAQAFAKRLSMFVLRAKAQVTLADDLQVLGCLLGPEAPDELKAQPWLRVPDAQGDWISAAAAAGSTPRAWRVVEAGQTLDPGANQAAWRVADIQAGLPWIRTGTQDLFIPQTLNMDLNGGIDFKKGCYPGQEIIARSHYRGTVKRRMARGSTPWANSLALPQAGADLYIAQGDGRPAGRIIDLAHDGQTLYLLAERSLGDADTSGYSLGGAKGPVIELFPVDPAAPAA